MQVSDYIELYFTATMLVAAIAVIAEPVLLPLLHLLRPSGFSTAHATYRAASVHNMPTRLVRAHNAANRVEHARAA